MLLSGPSAVGKTTTAIALLELLSVPAVYWPRESVRVGGVTSLEGGPPAGLDLEQRLFTAYVDALEAYARRDFVVIGEAIIMDRLELDAARTALPTPSSLLVRLVAPLETLVERERVRATTFPGTAADTFARGFTSGPYDLTVDTAMHHPTRVAAAIQSALEAR